MLALSRNRPLSIDKTIFYLEQVCSGLAHAHAGGVIHRDIKPQNLLLTADRQIVKIADFGVARLETNDGAITRVGTNVYSAPEHNPLVQTGPLDTGLLALKREHLTPSADIYSLAKTTYSLLVGESPRRFAQHSIRELPDSVSQHYWSAPVLRVLEKATQTRPENRYQTVQEFWDELAEAALPPTRRLSADSVTADDRHRDRKPSSDLAIEVTADDFAEAPPPKARFEPVQTPPVRIHADKAQARRPKIVVPVSVLHRSGNQELAPRASAKDRIAALPNQPRKENLRSQRRGPAIPQRSRPLLVAVLLVAAFSGMLLATHKYVTSHWNPFSGISRLSDMFVVGSEGVTTTDVRLRPDASTSNPSIGLAENGSRVKILSTSESWYEVQVLEHGRPKTDPFTSDRGWINKKFVKF